MKVAVIVFVAVEADQIRKLRGADRHSELRAERSIRAGFLNRDADGMVFVQRLSVTELRIARRDHAGRTFKLQSVGKGIRIGEGAPGLPGQKILVLSIKLAQTYRVPVVVAQEVKLEIDLYLVSAVIESSLPGLPGESGRPHRNRRILRMRRGRRRKAGRNIGAIVCPRIVQVIEEIGFYKAAEFHVSAGAWKVKEPEQFRIQRLIIDAGRAYLVFSRRSSGPGFGAIVFHRSMYNRNLVRLWNAGYGRDSGFRNNYRARHWTRRFLCLLQRGDLRLHFLDRLLRGLLEFQKLLLEFLDVRCLSPTPLRPQSSRPRQSAVLWWLSPTTSILETICAVGCEVAPSGLIRFGLCSATGTAKCPI